MRPEQPFSPPQGPTEEKKYEERTEVVPFSTLNEDEIFQEAALEVREPKDSSCEPTPNDPKPKLNDLISKVGPGPLFDLAPDSTPTAIVSGIDS